MLLKKITSYNYIQRTKKVAKSEGLLPKNRKKYNIFITISLHFCNKTFISLRFYKNQKLHKKLKNSKKTLKNMEM